jgi:co-chaperonin GroES (HSP10)
MTTAEQRSVVEYKRVFSTNVMVRPIKNPTKIGSIYTPSEFADKNTQSAVVKLVGDEVKSGLVEPGAVVMYHSLSGIMVDKKQNLLLVKEEDLLGRVENGE